MPKSVFGRAFAVLLLSGVLTQAAITALIVTLTPGPDPSKIVTSNLHLYLHYLAEDLERQPTEAHAKRLLSDTGFDARLRGAIEWRTDARAPAAAPVIHTVPFIDGTTLTLENGRPVFEFPLRTPAGASTLTLLGPEAPILERPASHRLLLLGALLLVFGIASLAMRRILSPIRTLSSAFETVKGGNTDVRVPASGDDELGRLSRAFNEMAASLHYLIQDKERLFLELSHEFRAPIARATAANAFVEETETQDAIRRELLELDSLIHALLTAARLEAGHASGIREDLDVADLLEEVHSLFPEANGRLQLRLESQALLFRGDRRSLRMLVRNLVENALKYSAPDRRVELRAGATDSRIFITVHDEGMGIPPLSEPRLGEPFYRGEEPAKLSQPGFGLGLSLCRRVARAHGGELRMESAPGKGTTMTAWFPRAA